MADVRSLLKSERATRRIVHPYARYSDSGKLACSLCDILIKSDSAWKGHVRTPDHAKRALRAAEASAQQNSKKRKAGSDDEDTRKRVRGAEEESEGEDGEDEAVLRTVRFAEGTKDAEPDTNSDDAVDKAQTPATNKGAAADNADDDPEWLEFQRMISESAAPSKESEAHASVTISAAPMTAEEVAAQAREEQSAQKGRREAELEDEKEDAAQALEAEFDEMDELEERVRKLREKREALRSISSHDIGVGGLAAPPEDGQMGNVANAVEVSDDDEDDEEVWNFGVD